MSHPRWTLGHERFQGPGCSILGSHHWKCTDDAPRTQEFRSAFLPLLVLPFSVADLVSFPVSNWVLQSSRLLPALQAICSPRAVATCGRESGGMFWRSILIADMETNTGVSLADTPLIPDGNGLDDGKLRRKCDFFCLFDPQCRSLFEHGLGLFLRSTFARVCPVPSQLRIFVSSVTLHVFKNDKTLHVRITAKLIF